MEPIAIALFLALVGERLTAALVEPVFTHFKLDRFWLLYIAWAITAGVVALSQVNLFAAYIPSTLAGMALTALVCGGGSNLIHDLFDRGPKLPNSFTLNQITPAPADDPDAGRGILRRPDVPRDEHGGLG